MLLQRRNYVSLCPVVCAVVPMPVPCQYALIRTTSKVCESITHVHLRRHKIPVGRLSSLVHQKDAVENFLMRRKLG